MANKLELPSLSKHLLHFECAARCGSFSAAAKELKQSQPAVSHSIRVLEEKLSVRLFERLHRGVKLSREGQTLFAVVQESLSAIHSAYNSIRDQSLGHKDLSLSVSTALASHQILPKIADFRRLNPDVQLSFITHDTDDSIRIEEADLIIPLGVVKPHNWTNYERWHLVDEVIYPVCAPHYLKNIGENTKAITLKTVADMRLIHLEERYEGRMTWQHWFNFFGLHTQSLNAGNRFNDYSVLVQTALEGQGVILGWKHIVEPLEQQGRLVRLGSKSIKTQNPFYLLASKKRPLSAAAEKLKTWLVEEAFKG